MENIKRRTPPLHGTLATHFLSHFFRLQLNLTYMKGILHYNWFEIDILRLLLPLTAIFSLISSHLNHYKYII